MLLTSREIDSAPKPKVSIILPTYNRARFLPEAIDSIRAQTFADWELIVVDDGSTDETGEVVRTLAENIPQSIRYVHQENRGAYGARNTGLELANGPYVAFFDSDDRWMPHHLERCVSALERNPDVDWVHGAGRVVELATGREVCPNTHYKDGRPKRFLSMRTRREGSLRIIDDPRVLRFALEGGFSCGLQKSVIRMHVFRRGRRFRTHLRNEAEDRLMLVRALADGRRVGYFDEIHVEYRIHEGNSTAPGADVSIGKRLRVVETMIRGYEELGDELELTLRERRVLKKRIAREYFWKLGYALYWAQGRRADALREFRRGLRLWPWDISCWKTFLLSVARTRGLRA